MRFAIFSILTSIGSESSYMKLNVFGWSQASATASAISAAPAPPLEKPSFSTAA